MPFALPIETTSDPLGAFVAHAPYSLTGYGGAQGDGPLSGLTMGIKDLFDVAGLRTGNGSPTWLAAAEPATGDAPVVAALLDAGARFVGKTLTDEIAWSLNGENAHYGTPVNVVAPGRIPGGSSAGSAAAVAGGLVDFALGSDTGGSVRAPASYCGIWGLRPTHGRISLEGAMALAPSFDTAGWFAKTPEIMAQVGDILFSPQGSVAGEVKQILVAQDLFGRVDDTAQDALLAKAHLLADRIGVVPNSRSLSDLDTAIGGPSDWRDVFRIVQSSEAWQVHGAWAEAKRPDFGPGVKERFAMAKALKSAEIDAAKAKRVAIRKLMEDLVPPGTVLVVPGAASIAPLKGLSGTVVDDIRARALDVLCPAGLAGLPQLAVPALTLPDGPIGLGLVGWRGGDEALLALSEKLRSL